MSRELARLLSVVRIPEKPISAESGEDVAPAAFVQLALAVTAAEMSDPAPVEQLLLNSRLKGSELSQLQDGQASESLSATALFEDFSMAVWSIHRLAKLLTRLRE